MRQIKQHSLSHTVGSTAEPGIESSPTDLGAPPCHHAVGASPTLNACDQLWVPPPTGQMPCLSFHFSTLHYFSGAATKMYHKLVPQAGTTKIP